MAREPDTMDAGRQADRSADFGVRLKRRREERGIALREIAETTKISVSVLEALERSDISRLPGGIFSRGFVRAYAEQIGADPEVTVREFIALFPQDSVTNGSPYVTSHEIDTTPPSHIGRRVFVAAVIFIPIAAMIAWSILSSG
jgi:cytoskeletal protein RodZ